MVLTSNCRPAYHDFAICHNATPRRCDAGIANAIVSVYRGPMFTGDFSKDMEIAKGLIAKHPRVDVASLMRMAADNKQPESARIAAIYTLGFTDDDGVSRSTLSRIVANQDEPAQVRDHAVEALGYLTATH